MKLYQKLTFLGLLSIFSGAVNASHSTHNSRTPGEAYAQVISAIPVYETVQRRFPSSHCWVETERIRRARIDHRTSPAIVGGVIGGAIGHAIGHGHKNKRLGAAVGTVLGMAIGNDIKQHHRRSAPTKIEYRDVERCERHDKISTFEQLVGYDVTYQYSGQRYTTHMREHPGDRIRVVVDVRPVE